MPGTIFFTLARTLSALAPEAALREARRTWLSLHGRTGWEAEQDAVKSWVHGPDGRDAIDKFNRKHKLGPYHTDPNRPAVAVLLPRDVFDTRPGFDPFDDKIRDAQARQEVREAWFAPPDLDQRAKDRLGSAAIGRWLDKSIGAPLSNLRDGIADALPDVPNAGTIVAVALGAAAAAAAGFVAKTAGARPKASLPIALGAGGLTFWLTRPR